MQRSVNSIVNNSENIVNASAMRGCFSSSLSFGSIDVIRLKRMMQNVEMSLAAFTQIGPF